MIAGGRALARRRRGGGATRAPARLAWPPPALALPAPPRLATPSPLSPPPQPATASPETTSRPGTSHLILTRVVGVLLAGRSGLRVVPCRFLMSVWRWAPCR